jgi:hypothetical protein
MNYFIANSLCDVNIKNLIIGNTYNTPTREFTNIYIRDENRSKDLLLSTKILCTPWNKTYTNDELSFNIEFCNHENNFIDELSVLCNKIFKKFCKNKYVGLKVERGNDHFKVYPNESKVLRFFNVKTSDISVYDEDGSVLHISNISKSDMVQCLLHMKAFWYKDNKIGVELCIVQILRISPYRKLNDQNMLISQVKSSVNNEDHEIIKEYTRMIQIGIPLLTVQHIMENNHTLSEVQKEMIKKKLGWVSSIPISCMDNHQHPNQCMPKPPPPPPKKQDDDKKSDCKKVISGGGGGGLGRITIDDLQNALTKMKRISDKKT